VKNDLHAQAKDFIARRHVEGLTLEDERWLRAHLAGCESCAAEHRQLNESLSAMRAMHLDCRPTLPAALSFAFACAPKNFAKKNRLANSSGRLPQFPGHSALPLRRGYGTALNGSARQPALRESFCKRDS